MKARILSFSRRTASLTELTGTLESSAKLLSLVSGIGREMSISSMGGGGRGGGSSSSLSGVGLMFSVFAPSDGTFS